MKVLTKLVMAISILALASCSAQRQLTSRLTGEWEIEKYEVRRADGGSTTLENAGNIQFRGNGRGTQTFTSAIAQMDAVTTGDFRWSNDAQTVYITGERAAHRKAWIIVESKRNSQHWRSTDSEGNLQIMHLRKKY